MLNCLRYYDSGLVLGTGRSDFHFVQCYVIECSRMIGRMIVLNCNMTRQVGYCSSATFTESVDTSPSDIGALRRLGSIICVPRVHVATETELFAALLAINDSWLDDVVHVVDS